MTPTPLLNFVWNLLFGPSRGELWALKDLGLGTSKAHDSAVAGTRQAKWSERGEQRTTGLQRSSSRLGNDVVHVQVEQDWAQRRNSEDCGLPE